MLEILGLPSVWSAVLALVTGTFVGSLIGLIPGIGGRMGIMLTLPLAAMFDPHAAAIYLFSLHSVVNTSGSIPAIAFGVPTSGADAATVVDGAPLARMGRAGEALGASLSASAIGGVIGALAFLIAIPVARPLISSFGPPELLLLALFGVAMISSISQGGLLPGLIVACIGALFAIVGQDFRTGEQRFTFDNIDLWDGLDLPALICGMFVIPEMLSLQQVTHDAKQRAVSTTMRDVYRGMFVTFRYNALLIRSSLYGILIGATPAVGSTVGVWIAYAHAARSIKSEVPFGKGAIAGVIAPEAANNSKEGGAMIPTLFFGIPGSSSMAVMMAALAYCGIAVGPTMLNAEIGLSYTLAATVLLSNLLAVPFFFAAIPWIVRFSALRMDAIAPLAIIASVTAAMASASSLSTAGQILSAAILGLAFKRANWPRGPFVLGFVIQQMAESSAFQTVEIWGWSALYRPQTLGLLVVLIVWLAFTFRRQHLLAGDTDARSSLMCSSGLTLCLTLVVAQSAMLSREAGLAPLAISATALLLCTLVASIALSRTRNPRQGEGIAFVPATLLFVATIPIVGLPVASASFLLLFFLRQRIILRYAVGITALAIVAQLGLLAIFLDFSVEKSVMGLLVWHLLGH